MGIKPILFSTQMVKAILENRKTMTRRVIKPQPNGTFDVERFGLGFYEDDEWVPLKKPFSPGDVLWVRETWNYGFVEEPDSEYSNDCWFEQEKPGYRPKYSIAPRRYWYKADPEDKAIMDEIQGPWRPSIFMPKEACRIFLRVTGVRVERLQEISNADAKAEGIPPEEEWPFDDTPREMFAYLWDDINAKRNGGAYAWDSNPWVWVVQFERTERPEGWPL